MITAGPPLRRISLSADPDDPLTIENSGNWQRTGGVAVTLRAWKLEPSTEVVNGDRVSRNGHQERISEMDIPSYTYSSCARSLKCTSKVSDRRQIWRLVWPLVLVALLMATLGGVSHHHANAPADTCPICHLNHQAIEPTPASVRVSIQVATGPGPEPQQDKVAPSPAIRRIPVRGPPA
jgi:hypothetical protein